jgi:hypothetical protein
VRVCHGSQNAICLLLTAQLETAVYACDDEIEARQNVIWVIQRSVRKDVGLDAQLAGHRRLRVHAPVEQRPLFPNLRLSR